SRKAKEESAGHTYGVHLKKLRVMLCSNFLTSPFYFAYAATFAPSELWSWTSASGAEASQVVGQTPQRVHWLTDGQGAVERATCARSCSCCRKARPKPASTISHGNTSS